MIMETAKTDIRGRMVTWVTQEKIHFAQTMAMCVFKYSKKRFIGCNVVHRRCYNVTTYIQKNVSKKTVRGDASLKSGGVPAYDCHLTICHNDGVPATGHVQVWQAFGLQLYYRACGLLLVLSRHHSLD